MKNNYQNCENELLSLYLNKELFNKQNDLNYLLHAVNNDMSFLDNRQPAHASGIELIIRPECNQKCEYCYIARYGDELYPKEERASNEVLLKNLDMLLTYIFTTRHTYINHFELFAGDLFYDNIYFDILDIFYKHLSELYKDYPTVVKTLGGLILTPSNFSFIENDEKVARLESYMEKFKTINWDVGFSISTDGKEMVATREQRSLSDEYFEKLFQWTLRHPRSGFHAIISASNVENMIASYDWWKEQYIEHYFKSGEEVRYCTKDFLPYWLEARNDDWTDESIAKYLEFIDYAFADRLAMHNYDPEKLAYHLFCGNEEMEGTMAKLGQNDPIRLDVSTNRWNSHEIGCSISHLVCLTLNNFALIPCHRLNYPQFRGGYLTLNEEGTSIVDVEAFNMAGLLSTKFCHSDARPKCATCAYVKMCDKGCLGAQFESSGEVFQPVLSVCRLFKAWYNHLILLYYDSGVYDAAFRLNLIQPDQEPHLQRVLEIALRNRQKEKFLKESGGIAYDVCS